MRKFADGAHITVEPWRAAAFPIIKDLCVDRVAFDRIIEAGGYITVPTGSAPDANLIPVPKAVERRGDGRRGVHRLRRVRRPRARTARRSSSPRRRCTHLNLLPQGQPERCERVLHMVDEMERWFGSCTKHGECEAACPKEISIDFIALMNRDYVKAQFKQRRLAGQHA